MTVRAVLFDLDGTLLDTLDDIADAANVALAAEGLPIHPRDAYRAFIGDGVEVLCRRAAPQLADDEAAIGRLVDGYRAAYRRTWNARSHPYDGIPELLDAIAARGLALGVLSNKPDEFTRRCVEHYLGRWPWRAVLGAAADRPRKPDPAGAIEAAGRLGVPAGSILYVGDTATDVETARAAGMVPIGVSWGFRPASELREAGAVAVVDRPGELLRFAEGDGP